MTASRNDTPAAERQDSGNAFLAHLRLPPITVSDGTARLEFVVDTIHLRHGGIVHGGVYASVFDTVAGYAAYSIAPAGAEVVTMQLNMNMTAAAKLGERIIATAKAVHSGRRTAVIQGELRRGDGKLLTTGSATIFFVSEGLAS